MEEEALELQDKFLGAWYPGPDWLEWDRTFDPEKSEVEYQFSTMISVFVDGLGLASDEPHWCTAYTVKVNDPETDPTNPLSGYGGSGYYEIQLFFETLKTITIPGFGSKDGAKRVTSFLQSKGVVLALLADELQDVSGPWRLWAGLQHPDGGGLDLSDQYRFLELLVREGAADLDRYWSAWDELSKTAATNKARSSLLETLLRTEM